MKIISLNAWGGKLAAQLLAYLKAEAPDVVCLQEVIHCPQAPAGAEWLTYRDGDHVLNQRANLFAEVCRALPHHAATFCPAAQGPLWDGDRAVPSFWGLATFVHSALPVIAQAQGFVHGAYATDGFGAHPRARSAHAIRLHDPARNRMLSITQMHGLRDLRGKMDTPERLDQAHRVLGLSRQVTLPGDLAVICGDFNVEPDSQTLALLQQAGFAELVTGRGFGGTRTSHYRKPGRFADYMLVNRDADVTGFSVVSQPEVSDHCPLLLEI